MDKQQLNHKKYTKAGTNWFTLDITDFYPSIIEYTLDKPLELAAQHVPVSQYDIRIIKHCHKSLLFYDSKPWIKKLNSHLFDVTMGSFDGQRFASWSVP